MPTPIDQAPPPPPVVAAAIEERSTWQRLRERFAMTRCEYSPGVRHFVGEYSRSPRSFAASWGRALPLLAYVADELERRDLPGEFAMLPYVESGYRPLPSRGDNPAGLWQLVPSTARAAGVIVQADYDGRLDALASTTAALDLIARYHDEFADWRLADMAFNSGEFRVKKLLGERDARDLSAEELSRFTFNRITHEHLDRLLALACIVQDPARFSVVLPEPDAPDHLRSVDIGHAMDLRLAAKLAGVPVDDLRRWNAGYRRNRMPDGGPHRLLLPEERVARFQAAADAIAPTLWNEWREERAQRTSGIASWAAQLGIPVSALAAANAVGEDATVTAATRLLLPGREAEAADDDAIASNGKGLRRTHVIVAGDSLSSVAHRYAIPLRRLRQLNPQANGTLHLGQKLRLDDGQG
jgi:membrane-bound lytic murein transglycosylase D